MNNQKFQNLKREITKIDSLVKELGVPEAVLIREVKCFGNGGHIVLPKEHLNKKVKIIVS